MEKVYKGQTALQVRLNTGISLHNALECRIKYKKPNGTQGYWIAERDTSTTYSIFYNVESENTLDIAGTWTLWSYIIFNDGKEAPGAPVSMTVFEEGK